MLDETIAECIINGSRLSDESFDLEFRDPPRLQLYVLLIAQEEFAKAFILLLVRDGIIPFSRPLLRAINDHACKQLASLIMDYVAMRWETIEEAKAMVESDAELGDRLPPDIESAVLLLRFEKVGRWESSAWVWNEQPTYHTNAKRIADGKADRRKQDALYVRVGGDGRVCPSAPVTEMEVNVEKDRLRDFQSLVTSMMNMSADSSRYAKAMSFIRKMFALGV